MTQQLVGPVYFKLKDAQEYGFWGRGGQRRLLVKRGEVITMTTKKDIDYFRARGLSCDAFNRMTTRFYAVKI